MSAYGVRPPARRRDGTGSARRAIAAATAVALTFTLAGCFSSPDAPPDEPPPAPEVAFVDCAALTGTATEPTTEPSPAAPSVAPTATTGALAVKLPDLVLPCAADGAPVPLRQLRGPLVINLWASWCGPCVAELPALQRLAATGSVPVLGINTDDRKPGAAAWLNHDFGIRFPSLTDRDAKLQKALGETVLPLTIIVRADGELVIHRAPTLNDDSLRALLAKHLGAA